MRRVTVVTIGIVGLWLCSCASFEGTAQSAFVHAESCPADRVTAHELVTDDDGELPDPAVREAMNPMPPEVAADPARAQVWKDDEETKERRLQQNIERQRLVEVSGCGTTHLYTCTKSSSSRHTRVTCDVVAPPAAPSPELPPIPPPPSPPPPLP